MNKGSLYDSIHKRTLKFDFRQKVSILLDIASGLVSILLFFFFFFLPSFLLLLLVFSNLMPLLLLHEPPLPPTNPRQKYLHSQSFIHRDLKSQNVLLSQDEKGKITAKLADFGLSRFKDGLSQSLNSRNVGTPITMAPEVVSSGVYNVQCDIFSFAIIMWELYFEDKPYKDEKALNVVHFKVSQDPNFRPVINKQNPNPIEAQLFKAMRQSWSHKPTDRPTAAQLEEFFQKMLSNIPK